MSSNKFKKNQKSLRWHNTIVVDMSQSMESTEVLYKYIFYNNNNVFQVIISVISYKLVKLKTNTEMIKLVCR